MDFLNILLSTKEIGTGAIVGIISGIIVLAIGFFATRKQQKEVRIESRFDKQQMKLEDLKAEGILTQVEYVKWTKICSLIQTDIGNL